MIDHATYDLDNYMHEQDTIEIGELEPLEDVIFRNEVEGCTLKRVVLPGYVKWKRGEQK